MTSRKDLTVTRRGLFAGAGSAAALGVMGGAAGLMVPGLALAQVNGTVITLMVGAVANEPLRDIMETEAGIEIDDAPFQSTTDSVSKLLAPGGTSRYDVLGTGTAFSELPVMGARAGDEKVLPLDLTRIPNVEAISESFAADIKSRDGQTYLIPLFWGYDSVLYNTEEADPEDEYTQSWAMIFDDKYAGRIAWFDTAHQMLMAAGLYLGKDAPETMDQSELNEVVDFLISKKKNVRTFWTSFAQASSLLGSGEIVATYGPIPVRAGLQRDGFPITNAWPKEGVLSFTLAGYIPKEAPNPEGAHAYLNTFLGRDFASNLAEASGYLTTSKLGLEGLDAETSARLGYGILEGTTAHYPLNLPPDMGAWIEAWSRIKSA